MVTLNDLRLKQGQEEFCKTCALTAITDGKECSDDCAFLSGGEAQLQKLKELGNVYIKECKDYSRSRTATSGKIRYIPLDKLEEK